MIVHIGGNVLFGLIILAIGSWIANIASNNFIKSGENTFVASIVKVAILAIFLAIGLRKMGIADDIINLAFGITLSAVALTIVLSFGLGGREAAGKQIKKHNPTDRGIDETIPKLQTATPIDSPQLQKANSKEHNHNPAGRGLQPPL